MVYFPRGKGLRAYLWTLGGNMGENRFHLVILADIRLWTCDGALSRCDRCRIKFCVHHNHLELHHKSTGECQQEKLESAYNFYYVNIM